MLYRPAKFRAFDSRTRDSIASTQFSVDGYRRDRYKNRWSDLDDEGDNFSPEIFNNYRISGDNMSTQDDGKVS